MAKNPKRPRDINQLAKSIVDLATGDVQGSGTSGLESNYRHGAAGGETGGYARAAALSPESRKEIARKAAEARWKKK